MLETWQAKRFDHVMPSGRTKPLVIACSKESSNLESDELPVTGLFVVKALGLPEITDQSLFNEIFGNLLAREFGLDTPAPCLIHLSVPFVEATRTVLSRKGLTLDPSICSGL